jgi:hypothetical protein
LVFRPPAKGRICSIPFAAGFGKLRHVEGITEALRELFESRRAAERSLSRQAVW